MDLRESLETLARCEELLASLRRECDQLPPAIEALEEKMREEQAQIEAERGRLEDAEQQRRRYEAELADREVQREKFQAQTAMVKTNAEYSALLHEIDAVTLRIGELEEEILKAMDTVDALTREVDAGIERHGSALKVLESQISERRERLEVVRSEVTIRGEELQALLDVAPDPLREHYARVRTVRSTGTARLRGRSCGACNRDVPFEVVNRVHAGEFRTCGACQRILVEEEA
ncbi:MAG: zinc ribbon domain-containing protein [Myxococcota bacterium]